MLPRYATRMCRTTGSASRSQAPFRRVRHHRRVTQQNRPRIIGHRGAPAVRPEHSASAYRAAVAAGADAVEPDVVPTRDGVLAVRHEPVLDGTTDVADRADLAGRRATHRIEGEDVTGWFANDLDWDEVRSLRARERLPGLRPDSARHDGEEPVLRLRELVELLGEADGRTGLVIELKHPAFAREVGHDLLDAVERELDGRWGDDAMAGLVWESFEHDELRRLRERGLPGRVVALVDGVDGDDAALLDELATWADGVSVSDRRLGLDGGDPADSRGRRLVDGAHARGLEVFTWTLRPEDEFLPDAYRGRPEEYWRDVAATGVDAVFADDPARARAVFDRP